MCFKFLSVAPVSDTTNVSTEGPQEINDPELLKIGTKKTILWGLTSLTECGDYHAWKLASVKIPCSCRCPVCLLKRRHSMPRVHVGETSLEAGRTCTQQATQRFPLSVKTPCTLRGSRYLLILLGRGDSSYVETDKSPVILRPVISKNALPRWSEFTLRDSGPSCDPDVSCLCGVIVCLCY